MHHRFEIVRRADRYSWLLVEVEGAQRRVRARSQTEYPTATQAKAAVVALQHAQIEEVGDPDVRVSLPNASFTYVDDVQPLIFGPSRNGDDDEDEDALVNEAARTSADSTPAPTSEPATAAAVATPARARSRTAATRSRTSTRSRTAARRAAAAKPAAVKRATATAKPAAAKRPAAAATPAAAAKPTTTAKPPAVTKASAATKPAATPKPST